VYTDFEKAFDKVPQKRLVKVVTAIDCFVCASINGSEPECDDTFNNIGRFFETECKAGRKQRQGKFPGTSCIKLKAYLGDYTVLVRDCTVDNGDTTSDTEMGRESHCWMVNQIVFDDIEMNGCALACNTDGCNTAGPAQRSARVLLAPLVAVLTLALVRIVTG